MLPKYHMLIGVIVASMLVLFFNIPLIAGLIIFLANTLIDFDHYIIYVFKKKDFNLKRAYKYMYACGIRWNKLSPEEKTKKKLSIFAFHGLEAIILALAFSYFNILFIWVAAGMIVHLSADFIEVVRRQDPFYFKISTIYVALSNKNKKSFN